MYTVEELCRRVEALAREHRDAPFPREVYAIEPMNGTSLVLLDANISGCVDTFLARGYALDLWRTATLGVCFRDVALALASPDLVAEARPYYARLETLAGLVLEVVARTAKDADDT
ncbi:MAG TPA: hypothetical protein VM490_20010 [Armatimonadaceae bacterium]|nr:hypothetical protein [Armatimonadaceae bacterium]